MDSSAANLAGGVGALVVATPALHLGLLTAAAARRHRCGRSDGVDVLVAVPAHDEAATIARTLRSLGELDYPADRREVLVIADNCTDDTAAVARSHGATVLERFDAGRRGKGPALDWAFRQVLARPNPPDVVVVVDADTEVDPGLLRCVAFHVAAGASAVQVDYRVRNPAASWRTRLLDVAFTCKHRVRGRGRDALGWSVGLRGNGMAFTRELLTAVPYSATSVVEDVEYGMLLVDAGRRVVGCDGTYVAGDMPDDAGSASSQRIRWELGHAELRRRWGLQRLLQALRRRDLATADACADVVTPPLGTLVAAMAVAGAASVAATGVVGPAARRVLGIAGASLVVHVGVGLAISPSSWRAIPALARIPGYLLWKLGVRRSDDWHGQAVAGGVWTRTNRSADLPLNSNLVTSA